MRLTWWSTLQAIIGLHESGLTNEEKAAASKKYYRKGKAARKSPVKVHRTRAIACEEADEPDARARAGGNARSRLRSDVASRQGRADPSQPFCAQSPTEVNATNQVSR